MKEAPDFVFDAEEVESYKNLLYWAVSVIRDQPEEESAYEIVRTLELCFLKMCDDAGRPKRKDDE